ncbi:breast cancer type 1 susceptibility protein homolog [Dendronephthya gigantea]|uniref:breast cancer type 1 susceptibility protein homolog n=1 Tax=Dendronephthya gigantea TaxID=151771 RepID=UPI00106C878F|nr:breast cancer type 1 susceptibility protein homolog [Dendronephthya gigantea]
MDPNTAIVFETIGLIKKSLQCSICLDLFNDPHSTRCNHQFCSCCIKKVVDERKEKNKEALCPLCKNPITKRSLTSNPRLREIVEVVRRLNLAFQEDAGIPDSPYPLVNTKLSDVENKNCLQSSFSNPTPLKPSKFKRSTLGGVTKEQQLDSSVNHESSNHNIFGEQLEKNDNALTPQERRCSGFEILSLLESKEDAQTELTNKQITLDDEVSHNDELLKDKSRNTELPNTGGSSQTTQLQTAKSPENGSTANSNSSGSLTLDPRISSPSSVLSQDSVSLLDGLLSQQLCPAVENTDLREADQEVSRTQDSDTYHSNTDDENNILKSSQEEIIANCTPNTPNSRGATPNSIGNSNDIFSELQKSQNGKRLISKTPKTGRGESGYVTPIISNESDSERYSTSERVPPSVESDSESYKVIPLPRYEEYSDDEISPEFLGIRSRSVRSTPDCSHKRNDDFNPIVEEFSDMTIQSSMKEKRFGTIQSKQSEVASLENIANSQADIKNPDSSVISPLHSGGSLRLHQSKRKRSPGENDSLKCPRLSDERRGKSKTSIEKKNETLKPDCDNGLKFLKTNRRQANSNSKLQVTNEVRNASRQGTANQSNETTRKKTNYDQNLSQVEKMSSDTEDDIIPPTPPVRIHEPPGNGSNNEILNRFSRMENVSEANIHEVIEEDCLKNDLDDGINKSRTSRSQNTAMRNMHKDEIVDDDIFENDTSDDGGYNTSCLKHSPTKRESVCEEQEVDEDMFSKAPGEGYKTARPQNITTETESPRKNEMLVEDDWLGNFDNEGEVMTVNERSPIMEDDRLYSSQEDLNIALLKRLAPLAPSDKEREFVSDGETSDGISTSISSLTDGDGVEVTSQRINYLHGVLAQTGGEIEKLTKDLKKLRKSEDIAQTNKPESDREDLFEKNCARKIINNVSKNYRKNRESYEANHSEESNEDSGCEKEYKNNETSDIENNEHELEDASDSDCDEPFHNKHENNQNHDMFDLESNENNNRLLSDKKKEVGIKSCMNGDMKESDHEVEVDDKYDSHNEDDDEDEDEILEHCTLTPPPALDRSTLKLTKLPAAVQNLQKLLQEDGDSQKCPDTSDYKHSTRDKAGRGKAICSSSKVYGKNKYFDEDGEKIRLPKDRSNELLSSRLEQQKGWQSMNKEANCQIAKKESRLQGSQKENGAVFKRRSSARDLPARRVEDTENKNKNLEKSGGQPDEILTELRINTVRPKQRKLSSMMANSVNHEAGLASRSVKLPLCFVLTRLPKQFVSLADYLAKRNGGKVSSDVSEETTHLIMPTDSKMHASRKNYTIKYLLGVALGKWIVSQLWLAACVKSGQLVDEKRFEVKGDVEAAQSHVPNLARTTRENKDPLLFDGISVVCFGEFNGAISQGQIGQLVQYCGGEVIDNQEFIKHRPPVFDLIVICDTILSQRTGLQIKDLCKRHRTFPVSSEWITDSVANYQLQDIEEYRMDI